MKKWCTYGANGITVPSGIGLLINEHGGAGWIKYAEKQMYAPSCWDMSYVKIHDTIEDAIKYFMECNSQYSIENVQEELAFKVDVKWEDVEEYLHKKQNHVDVNSTAYQEFALVKIIAGACLKHADSGEGSYNKEARVILMELESSGYEIVKKK